MTDLTPFIAATSYGAWAKPRGWRPPPHWIPAPAIMPDGYDVNRWAQEFASAAWAESGLPYGPSRVDLLEAQLALLYEGSYGRIPCHDMYMQIPDPQMVPLPAYIANLVAEGDREARLRMLSMADDPAAIEPPLVEEFTTDGMGTGLRVLRHFGLGDNADPPEDRADGTQGQLGVGLSYAWRSEQYKTDVRLFSNADDWGRLQCAIPDLDALARSLVWFPVVKEA